MDAGEVPSPPVDHGAPHDLERVARPLLVLMQRIAHVETTFLTSIDWEAQEQEVIVALNTDELQVDEGSQVDWSESMCRWAFVKGTPTTHEVARDYPGSVGAERLGMKTFFAVPILRDDKAIGTVCGASRRPVDLGDDVIDMMRLIGEATSALLAAEIARRKAQARADRAEQEAADALARSAELSKTTAALEQLALVDPLTGLANRRGFTARWEEELARSGRRHLPVALLLIDIDEFKLVNDTYGHLVGDDVLASLGTVLRALSRAEDVAARVGGDEFALLLPHTGLDGAGRVAQRIGDGFAAAARELVAPCTISIGVASSETTERHLLYEAADTALYRSKFEGRARVTCASS